ncbi:MAG: hypothetical protein RBR53_03915 [Desulforegulaceae bacterium]|nr:hypothetical protein [Desulforegulaceae bacterium]
MENKKKSEKLFYYKNGKLWFSKKAERKIFFFMTIIMLGTGVGYLVLSL